MDKKAEEDLILEGSVALAKKWQEKANELLYTEKKKQKKFSKLIKRPIDRIILMKLLDQCFRSNNKRIADQIVYIFKKNGIPHFFSLKEKLLLQLFLVLGKFIPDYSVHKIIKDIKDNSNRLIIPGEANTFFSYLAKRKNQNIKINVNHIGEAVLSEYEAMVRLKNYVHSLKQPEIENISIKISTIYSQIQSIAFDHTVNILVERLSELYRTAKYNHFNRKDCTKHVKFVNLDMEEYRDLELTVEVFKKTLDQEEFRQYKAGIVLQAYLPDSYGFQKGITEWAIKRIKNGGSPIQLRIVKGANMEMEIFESYLHNWPLAPYDNKLSVDANFKRMVEFGMRPENIRAVNLGIGSHNLFELAFAYKIAEKNKVTDYLTFELLEGMADHVIKAIQDISRKVLLYTPVAKQEQFISAVGYLFRRLDENTSEENFLRHAENFDTTSNMWKFFKDQFFISYHYKDKAKIKPNRQQNRNNETFQSSDISSYRTKEFINEPDTDWTLSQNRKWADNIKLKWKKNIENSPIEIPLVIGGKELFKGKKKKECFDPSTIDLNNKDKKVEVFKFAIASQKDIESAIKIAKEDTDGWKNLTIKERHKILSKVAVEIRKHRGELIGSTCANTGKIFTEADSEVSEAVDFAEFYPFSADLLSKYRNIECKGKGVGVVISPWNFPIAIPCGGITVALAAGNTVLFKPSSDSVLSAWELCKCFWKGGISKNTLQFIPCSGEILGTKIKSCKEIDFIILTGGTNTGLKILKEKPDTFLCAETGGKNATIVTAMSDRDQAIKNVIHSAFSNTGQKCSATSLLILEKEVYDDPVFKKKLIDAVKSLRVGSAWKFENKISNIIKPPSDDLKNALETLEKGETWALKPEMIHNNPYMWTPGIKWGVTPGSYTHLTEFFGPLLGVMSADNLEQAIQLVNQTGYGLTSGLESLDTREQVVWKEKIRVGNLYINRETTGAIVFRQPFGGIGKSVIGAGIKAGGLNYITQFMEFEETGFPETGAILHDYNLLNTINRWNIHNETDFFKKYEKDFYKIKRAIKSYIFNKEQEFSVEKDYFKIPGQDNIIRYIPVGRVVVRLERSDTLFDVLARISAVIISECELIISIPEKLTNDITLFIESSKGKEFTSNSKIIKQSDDELIRMLPNIDRIRYSDESKVPFKVFKEAAKTGFYISCTKVLMEGKIELLQYYREQTISNNYHRYGYLGERRDLITKE